MRIKKQGIDYFPVETNILSDTRFRIVMKNNGDAAFTVIMALYSHIYDNNGYYINADENLYKNIEVQLFELSRQKIKEIVLMAVNEGIFSKEMFETQGILTSTKIQEQFFFCTQRRNSHKLIPQYLLVDDAVLPKKGRKTASQSLDSQPELAQEDMFFNETIADKTDVIVDNNPENVCKSTHSKEKQSKNNTPLTPLKGSSEEKRIKVSPQNTDKKRYSADDIATLQPPQDGISRNYNGLIEQLAHHRIDPNEQYVIIKRSNFGAIGNIVWKGLATLLNSSGKIKMPGRYLMSLFKQ